ncbi:MAG: FMN-binding protein [Beduini sp.]|uniref:FMN-binding protein n=1 Tax=Beduini sp. TaxID=1922300 RepID=UPI0039907229
MKKILWILSILLVISGCSTKEKSLYKDGEYIGVGNGKCGTIQVKITVSEGNLSVIDIIKDNETASYMSEVKEKLLPEIVGKNSLEGIDVVTGATASSQGVLEAVKVALDEALLENNTSGGSNE